MRVGECLCLVGEDEVEEIELDVAPSEGLAIRPLDWRCLSVDVLAVSKVGAHRPPVTCDCDDP